jgi:RND superfamily putative drug exporter
VTIEDVIVKAIAFGLAFGIVVDAFVVRMTLVPAVLALLGRSAWWLPRWLDRLLPDLDIEGARLTEGRPAVQPPLAVGDRV